MCHCRIRVFADVLVRRLAVVDLHLIITTMTVQNVYIKGVNVTRDQHLVQDQVVHRLHKLPKLPPITIVLAKPLNSRPRYVILINVTFSNVTFINVTFSM